ncbi:MAG: UDP-N-acetylglucosamine 2-epimerase (non-hydrolyzing) [Phycisphaeraceae bacterium]
MPRTISVIFGTRPEAIKLAPVVRALRDDPRFTCHACVTGQHRQMLDQVLDVFGIEPDEDLQLMRSGQGLAGLTARAIEAIDASLVRVKPDLVLVQGDTTTVLAASLAAFYQHVPIGHVEAGLRTGNLQSPWPEEANRVLTTRIADLHFPPTESARTNLLNEGVPDAAITVTGNTVIDALLLTVEQVRQNPPTIPGLPTDWREAWADQPMVLITGHRRESFGSGFEDICRAIGELASRFPETQFVYPVHLNPNVREPVQRLLGEAAATNVHLIEPLAYLPFVSLMDHATLLLTDSGGVQEEAPSLGKPVLVMRETTERPEAVDMGTVLLVGTDRQVIVDEVARLLTDADHYHAMANAVNPYGDGHATPRILQACADYFSIPEAAPITAPLSQ